MTTSQPDITINILPATETISNEPQRVLFIGQQLPAGSAVSGVLQEDIQNDKAEDGLFGKDSFLAHMIRAGRVVNKNTQFDAIGLDDDGSAVDATGNIVFAGTATETGELEVVIGSAKNASFTVVVTNGDTATVVGDALEALIAADTESLVVAANTTGNVLLTAKNGGLEGNTIGLRVKGTVAGITHSVTGMASGAGNPSLTNLFDVIQGRRYQTIIWPATFTLDDLTTELDARFNVTNDVLDGHGMVAQTDSLANHKTTGAALNSRSLTLLALKSISETSFAGPTLLEIPAVVAALMGSIRALRLTPGTNLSQVVITPFGARDQFGGPALATLPYFNTPFPQLVPEDTGKTWTLLEVEELKEVGISTISTNVAGNSVIADEILTTRKTDDASNPETTFKFLNAKDAASVAREFFLNNLKSRFVQSRLTEGAIVPGRSMANAETVQAECLRLYRILSESDFVITEAGETSLQFFADNLVVRIIKIEGKVEIDMVVLIVTQLRTILATLQISFSAN